MNHLQSIELSVSISNKQVCDNLNLNIEPGEVWGILGRNGVGKTTLLHTLAGLRSPDNGEILLSNKSINQLSRKQIAQQLGLLLQQSEESFPSSVIETVLTGRHPHIDNWSWESKGDLVIARQALELVQLSEMADRSIDQLSGGERQRVAIACLITQSPEIYLLDEPNSHLDLKYQIQLLDVLVNLARTKQKSILMTLHDLNLAVRYCDKLVMLLGDGKVLVGDTETLLTEDNLLHLYNHPIKKIDVDNHSVFIAN